MLLQSLRRLAALSAVALMAAFLSAAGVAPAQQKVQFSQAQKDALDRVSAYLNSIHSIRSGFMQLGPDGQLDQGQFYLEKPGRMRFAYYPPNPTLIVATAGKIYVKNSRLNTVSSYDVSDTPLGLLLGDNIDLKSNRAVTGADIRDDSVVVHAQPYSNRQQGAITLVFSSPQIELRQWTVKDNQGATTMVALRDPQPGATLDDALFTAPVKDPPRKAD